MIPSPSDLTYFLEVANLLNLSRAAECLGITQPSLTLAMQRIEDSVGTKILTRHKRGVSLTKAGKQLLAHTRLLLQNWHMVKSETLASMNKIQGCFTIGCHTSIARYTLPLFLATLMEENPKLEIKLKHDASRKITEQVINLNIDIGIAANPVKYPDLIIKKLCNDKITLWHNGTNGINQNFLQGKAILLCDPELVQTQSILKQMKKQGLHFARMVTSDNLEVIADLTKSGSGIGILPTNVAKTRKLTLITKSPVYRDEICLLYRGENRDIKAIQVITNAIKSAFMTA